MWWQGSNKQLDERHRVLLLGQVISVLVTVTSIFTQLLNQNYEIQISVTQSAGNYFLLCGYLIYPIMRYRHQHDYKLQLPWWQYLLIALADVEGNFLCVCAYKYTTISSAMLLDCFTIPVVMILSRMLLHARYTLTHIVAVAFCVGGICVLVLSDIYNHKNGWDSSGWNYSALFGDFLCLLGSAVYACSNVAQEFLVKHQNRRTEFLGMVGFYGFVISAVQAYLFEGPSLMQIEWSLGSAMCLMGYVVTLFTMYSFTSIFMKDGDAAIFNLSLLTSDFFAVVAAKFLFHETLTFLYCIGFVLIIGGIVLYNKAPAPSQSSSDEECASELVPLKA